MAIKPIKMQSSFPDEDEDDDVVARRKEDALRYMPPEAVTGDEVELIGSSTLSDPWRKGYEARMKQKPRRPRECYKGEIKELWYAGWDDADKDAKDALLKAERDLTLVNRGPRIN